MRKVFITAGHNVVKGNGTGAHGIIDEAKEAIVLRNSIVRELEKLGVKAFTDNDESELKDVISMVSKKCSNNDILIDIHFNAGVPNACGAEVIIPDMYTLKEKDLAGKLLDVVCSSIGVRRRRVITETETPRKRIGMLRYPNCNNLLVEVCFVTNAADVSLYQQGAANLARNIALLIKSEL